MNWLTPILIIYLSAIDPGGFIGGVDKPIFEANIKVGAELFDFIGVTAEEKTYSDFPDNSYFSPFQAIFIFNAYLFFEDIEVGYEHACYHPIYPGMYSRDTVTGGYDKIYFKYELRIE